jgi:hypothetical protein
MRKWRASIITAGVLCSVLLISFNDLDIQQKPENKINRLMSTTSLGEGF